MIKRERELEKKSSLITGIRAESHFREKIEAYVSETDRLFDAAACKCMDHNKYKCGKEKAVPVLER